ncbi:MAG TPA: hypothetical protein VHN19_13890 [Burkholderiales bacterium]|nr:hypothetical protein [Burkholderiales bacterium]
MENTLEHGKEKPGGETVAFFNALAGFAVATLVMVGFGATVYYLVAPGGWLAGVFGRNLAGGMAAVLALILIGVSVWLARDWIPAASRGRYSELFVYGFAAAGVMYLFDLVMKGAI